jgi:glucokinase
MLALVADIGGTNARFALAELDGPLPTLHHAKSLAAAQFASLQHAAEHYLSNVGQTPLHGPPLRSPARFATTRCG